MTSPEGSSASVFEKKDITDKHFRWESFRNFLFLANGFSSHVFNYDVFTRLTFTNHGVNVYEFLLLQIFIGMPYLFMDGFIKQYTRRIDGFKFLNPLLRGISFGQFLQTGFWSLVQSEYLADCLRYLVMTLRDDVPWGLCTAEGMNSSCTSINKIMTNCINDASPTDIEVTSAHFHYLKSFSLTDRSLLTTRCFIVGLVWVIIFFASTVTCEALVKIYHFAFIFRALSSMLIVFVLLLTVNEGSLDALSYIMDARSPSSLTEILIEVTYAYGVGYLGFYDFGTMSPHTMVDTAVIIYSVTFTFFAFVRSWILRLLYTQMMKCVTVHGIFHLHYFYFAVLPLSIEFLKVHRLYALYVYLNLIITITGYLTMQTMTMARLLHTEFRSLKNIYLVGLICCCGFILTIPITVHQTSSNKVMGFISGLNLSVLYLAAIKVAIIMWMYGIERFSTDIQFWLGFKPTRYWTLCWAIMPIFLFIMMIQKIFITLNRPSTVHIIGTFVWFGITILIVTILNIKTISKYLVRNNLASLFRANVKYGPPDPVDRLHRRNFSETIQLRYCKHNCQVIDDIVECKHLAFTSGMASGTESLEDIYTAERTSIKHPSLEDLAHHF